jgi:hypothetical protein
MMDDRTKEILHAARIVAANDAGRAQPAEVEALDNAVAELEAASGLDVVRAAIRNANIFTGLLDLRPR